LERLLENDGSGNYEYILGFTAGTLGIAVADLDGD
jgi:hypothetical protein